MPATTKPFTFICGDDDFLVSRRGRELFTEMSAGLPDEFSRETIEGRVQNLEELEIVLKHFRAAVQTISLFGDRKAVWLKDVNFLADTVTGRSEGAKTLVGDMTTLLETVDPSAVAVLITACPVDRRRTEYKWLQKNGAAEFLGGEGGGDALIGLAEQEAKKLGTYFAPGALQFLAAKVNGHTRLALEETRKLATYLGPAGDPITEKLIRELVPDFGEGDFFEPAEAFFSLDLAWTLDALKRYFFAGHSARPLLSSLQGRNRLMIQLRVLLDSGELRLGYRGLDQSAFDAARQSYARHFGGLEEKSTFNIFTQNVWYLGKLGEKAKALPLKRLIDFQTSFVTTFEEFLQRGTAEEESIMRELAVRCLG
ncbi:MAG TPA: DNA polymerase III subunit delta [Opitutales bacterium]|nr:DNA polymerase III subunit delta [Opitutales bacterium]